MTRPQTIFLSEGERVRLDAAHRLLDKLEQDPQADASPSSPSVSRADAAAVIEPASCSSLIGAAA